VRLILAGMSGATSVAEKFQLKRSWKQIGGFVSANFAELVGNQGGIRSAAFARFGLEVFMISFGPKRASHLPHIF
jgi:hypothetical protein